MRPIGWMLMKIEDLYHLLIKGIASVAFSLDDAEHKARLRREKKRGYY